MMPLFFYGTLRHRALLDIVLDAAEHLRITPARLPGYAVRAVAEGPFPGIVAEAGAVAEGLLVQGLRAEDVARLDFYEGGFDYTLTDVVLEDGQAARVYLHGTGRWTLLEPWSLERWVQDWGALTCHAAREVMGYFGTRSAGQVAAMFPAIRTRAWAQVNALSSRHGQGLMQGRVEVLDRRRVYGQFFALDEFDLRHERFSGAMSDPLARAVFVGMDAAIVLPYDPVRDRVLLVEQLRMGPLGRGDPAVWQVEPIAGHVDPGERPEDAARREAREEAGLELGKLYPVAQAYASPGNSTEFYYIFAGIADLPDDAAVRGGLASEDEDIRAHLVTFEALMTLCDTQRAANAPLVAAAYWLARHRARLRASA